MTRCYYDALSLFVEVWFSEQEQVEEVVEGGRISYRQPGGTLLKVGLHLLLNGATTAAKGKGKARRHVSSEAGKRSDEGTTPGVHSHTAVSLNVGVCCMNFLESCSQNKS